LEPLVTAATDNSVSLEFRPVRELLYMYVNTPPELGGGVVSTVTAADADFVESAFEVAVTV
jgi:hypothetical protein